MAVLLFEIAEDRRFVEVIEIADEKLHVVSANKEYFDKTVEGFKNITFVTFTTDGGSSQPININVHWIDEMTFEMKRKLIQVIPEVGVKISSGGQPLYQFCRLSSTSNTFLKIWMRMLDTSEHLRKFCGVRLRRGAETI